MTRVGREQQGHVGTARGHWSKVKTRGLPSSGLAPTLGPTLGSPRENTPKAAALVEESVAKTAKCDARLRQTFNNRATNPWSLSLDSAQPKTTNGLISPYLNPLKLDKFEPRRRVAPPTGTSLPATNNTSAPRLLPALHRTPTAYGPADLVDPSRSPTSPVIDLEGFRGSTQDLFARLDRISNIPLFQQLDRPGLYDDKVKKSPRRHRTMGDTDKKAEETNKQILHYVREKEAALDEVKTIKAELTETQSKLYDAMNLIEELEKKVPNDKKSKNTKKAAPAKKKPAPSPSKPATKGEPATRTDVSIGLSHPPVDRITAKNSREYYSKLAESFPNLPMMLLLDAEKKFMEADADNSGCIDKDELDLVLCKSVGLFTPKQVEEIFNEIDTDNNESVDFYEVLVILNKLHGKRRTNLPESVKQNYSKTCAVQ